MQPLPIFIAELQTAKREETERPAIRFFCDGAGKQRLANRCLQASPEPSERPSKQHMPRACRQTKRRCSQCRADVACNSYRLAVATKEHNGRQEKDKNENAPNDIKREF